MLYQEGSDQEESFPAQKIVDVRSEKEGARLETSQRQREQRLEARGDQNQEKDRS